MVQPRNFDFKTQALDVEGYDIVYSLVAPNDCHRVLWGQCAVSFGDPHGEREWLDERDICYPSVDFEWIDEPIV